MSMKEEKIKPKKLIIVNNNMKMGGVQKSLSNLLWNIQNDYDITLYLFYPKGIYMKDIPRSVHVERCTSLFRYLGMSQGECRSVYDQLLRGGLALLCRIFGRSFVMKALLLSQKTLSRHYDYAVSYLHNGNPHSFYGGVNEFVLERIRADKKIAYLHCDYINSGSNNQENNKLYYRFDRIAACSEGCRRNFLKVLPELRYKCFTVCNSHNFEQIRRLSETDTLQYQKGFIHVVCVSRLAHEKGIARAIRAAAYGIKQGLPLALHLVGSGKQYQDLVRLAQEKGIAENVHFYGEQSNPYRFMKNADLLLITSYHEAAPMIIEEAAFLGLPVLSTATSSSNEMIRKKERGWVCGNSQKAINRRLVYLFSDGKGEYKQIKQALEGKTFDNARATKQFRELLL